MLLPSNITQNNLLRSEWVILLYLFLRSTTLVHGKMTVAVLAFFLDIIGLKLYYNVDFYQLFCILPLRLKVQSTSNFYYTIDLYEQFFIWMLRLKVQSTSSFYCQ